MKQQGNSLILLLIIIVVILGAAIYLSRSNNGGISLDSKYVNSPSASASLYPSASNTPGQTSLYTDIKLRMREVLK